MTTLKKFWILIAAILLFANSESQARGIGIGVSFNYFHSRLNTYGDWIELDRGVVVWRPVRMHRGWSPYSQGSWIWTDCGWYWDSYEAYGDIVYHYGRWYRDDYYGWIWIPDYQWAPAWVEWRYDDDYIGWAPLPPYAEFGYNHGIHFSINFTIDYGYYQFIRYEHFGHSNQYSYYAPERYRERIYRHSRVENNYGYERDRVINRGIDRGTIERRGQIKVRDRQITFREDEMRPDNMSRVRTDRIEVSVPRERGSNETRDLNIKRGDRSSSLDLERVPIGRPERKPTETRTNTERKAEPAVRDDNRTNQRTAPDAVRNRENAEPKVSTERKAQPERETRVVEPRRESTPRQEVKNEARPDVRNESRQASRPQTQFENRSNTNREVVRERNSSPASSRNESRTPAREEKRESPRSNRER